MTDTISPMQRALMEAQRAAECGEVPVGAVIIDPQSSEVIATGHNQPIASHDPTAHAEIMAIRAAAEVVSNYRLSGLHLYVTLEPCAMCAGAISFARLAKVTFAAIDEKGGAIISGPRFFEQATCHWRPEVEHDHANSEAAATLLRDFFKARRS